MPHQAANPNDVPTFKDRQPICGNRLPGSRYVPGMSFCLGLDVTNSSGGGTCGQWDEAEIGHENKYSSNPAATAPTPPIARMMILFLRLLANNFIRRKNFPAIGKQPLDRENPFVPFHELGNKIFVVGSQPKRPPARNPPSTSRTLMKATALFSCVCACGIPAQFRLKLQPCPRAHPAA